MDSDQVGKEKNAPLRARSLWGRVVGQEQLIRVWRFALVSGTGLALDTCLFLLLVAVGARPGWANLVSAAAAVTFVYFASTRRVFAYQGRFLLRLFLLYVLYQVLAVSAASWALDAIVRLGVLPIVAKALILPITFTSNYLFMSFLTHPRY